MMREVVPAGRERWAIRMKWPYKALAISVVANGAVAASIPVLAFVTAWFLIPGASVAFWLCNLFDSGCKGWHENAAWVVGWFLNVIFCWAAIWVVGFLLTKRLV
jgi:hypothetical protein